MTTPAAATVHALDPVAVATPRVESIDLLRGLVMVVMVLDHVRDFFGDAKLDPTDLATTTPALFFTRWVTHFCAPTFMFLAGVSAGLSGARRTKGELSRHLLWRGLWLILLEQTWENVCIFFTYPQVVLGLVLWAIGWSMIALAALIHLPRALIAGVGLAMIALHNRFDGVQVGPGLPTLLLGLLHVPGFQTLPGGIPILIGYPLIPWIGVMAVGYASAPVFLQSAGRRRLILIALGLGSVAGFLAIRWRNTYGDPRHWAVQESPAYTVMSFLNCQKYPPSLLFLLMTLGPACLALAAFDRGLGRLGRPLSTLGRVPLFFYLLQWPLAHGLAVIVAAIQGEPTGWMFRFPPFQSPPGYGQSLARVYLFWAITVALLYYPSLWFSRWSGIRRGTAGSSSSPRSGSAA
jgi:uncharacterized membrane protein